MKLLVIVLFVSFMAVSPVYLLDQFVMPQLVSLSETYQGFDRQAAEIANVR